MGDWTFFSNHGHVLVCLARDRDARLRDVAVQVGITERAVQKIVRDMQDEGFLEIRKHGRRNRYRINNRKALRHSLQSGCTVGQLIALMNKSDGAQPVAPKQKKKTVPPAFPDAVPESVPEPGTEEAPLEANAPHSATSSRDSSVDDKPSKRDLEQGQLF